MDEKKVMAAMVQVVKQVSGKDISDEEAVQVLQGIYKKAQEGDQEATKQLTEIQKAAQTMLTQKAQHGAKLNYIKKIKGICPEGTIRMYFKAGGKICSKCVEKAQKGIEITPKTDTDLKTIINNNKKKFPGITTDQAAGRAKVTINGKVGYLNGDGKLIPPPTNNNNKAPYKNDKERKQYNINTMGGPKGLMAEG